MKKLLLFFILILSISIVSAEDFLVNNEATLYGNCLLANGSLGSDNASLTVFYPNSSTFIDNELMNEFSEGQFSYSFLVPNTTGIYPYSITCSKDSEEFTGSGEFTAYYGETDFIEVNVLGDGDSSFTGIIIGSISLIIFFIGMGFLNANFWLKFSAFGISLIELVVMYAIIYGQSMGKDISSIIKFNFHAILILAFAFGFVALFFYSLKAGLLKKDAKNIPEVGVKWGGKSWK